MKIKELTRVLCIITCSIGIYGADVKNMFLFLFLMFLTFWFVPGIIGFFFRHDREYDGELFIKEKTDEGINYILRLQKVADLPNKKELLINVRLNDPEHESLSLMDEDEDE